MLVNGANAQSAGTALDVLQIRPNFYMIAAAGSNIAVQTGGDGTILVDAGTDGTAESVAAAIKKLTNEPVRYIFNTGADTEHVSGNAKLSKAGRNIVAMGPEPLGGEGARDLTNNFAATVMSTETALLRMSAPTGKVAPFPSDAWPTETFTEKRKTMYFNHEGIELLRQSAHSDADVIVFFRASDVLAVGEIIDSNHFPVIDLAHGGSIQGEIDALNKIVETAVRPIPFAFDEGGTVIIPGRGRLMERIDAVEYRDMIVVIRDVIQDMIKRGMTLDQIKAAAPLKPYEPRYGAKTGPWTTNDFIEAVYKSLTGKK